MKKYYQRFETIKELKAKFTELIYNEKIKNMLIERERLVIVWFEQ